MFELYYLLIFASPITSQMILKGHCSEFVTDVQGILDISKYMGLWHELERYENELEKNGDCVNVFFKYVSPEEIKINIVYQILTTNKDKSFDGVLKPLNRGVNDGKFVATFPGVPSFNYWIVETDYQHYSIVWGCHDFGNHSFQYLWHFVRFTFLQYKYMIKFEESIKRNNFKSSLIRVGNTDYNFCNSFKPIW